jgi:SAM-dependent methyltransferase
MFARPHHELLRAEPRYFDIAFDTRDLEAECGFLHHLSLHLGRGRLASFLESCCGPGYHMHWFAAQGVRAYGIDVDPEMLSYAQEKASRLAEEARLVPDPEGRGRNGLAHPPNAMALVADPLDFSLPEAVDLAFCPRSSLRYLLEDDEVVAHLVAMAKNLGRGGLYVLELDHPAAFLGQRPDPERTWEAERDGVRVRVQRGTGKEIVDPLTHVAEVELIFDVEEQGRVQTIRDRAPLRFFTHRELRALVGLSGVFEWVAAFGDMNVTQPFDASEGSRRMIPVLRCSI